MSIVTKMGDGGETGLVGGKRVSKADVRLHAYGTVDELNALVGAALAGDVPAGVRSSLERLQHILFRLGADLATPSSVKDATRIEARHVREVETWIAALESRLPPLTHFILPGGVRAAAQLHVARTVCRRAERWIVALASKEPVSEQALVFVNRVGDYLFLAARETTRDAGMEDVKAEF